MSDDQTMGFTSEDDLDDFRHELDGYRPDAPNTEGPILPPKNLEAQICQCKSGQCRRAKGRKTFCCASWGKSCGVDCGCRGLCQNIWNTENKERLFGPGVDECTPQACFVEWYRKSRNRECIDMEVLVTSALSGLTHAANNDEDLKAFEDAWELVRNKPKMDAERQKWAQRFVRFAFTDKRDILGDGILNDWGWFFSHCGVRPSWVRNESTWHCWACGECKGTEEWHCAKCQTCAEEFTLPREGCGGVGSMYHTMKKTDLRAGS